MTPKFQSHQSSPSTASPFTLSSLTISAHLRRPLTMRVPCEKPIRPTTLPPVELMRRTVLRTSSSTSTGRTLVDVPDLVSEGVTGKFTQRLKGPQPSKKGRTPGPGWEAKGAGEFVSFSCLGRTRNRNICACKLVRRVGFYEITKSIPSRLSISKSEPMTLFSLAICTECTMALLPEPWKARTTGFIILCCVYTGSCYVCCRRALLILRRRNTFLMDQSSLSAQVQ